jgi:hypothetical protein
MKLQYVLVLSIVLFSVCLFVQTQIVNVGRSEEYEEEDGLSSDHMDQIMNEMKELARSEIEEFLVDNDAIITENHQKEPSTPPTYTKASQNSFERSSSSKNDRRSSMKDSLRQKQRTTITNRKPKGRPGGAPTDSTENGFYGGDADQNKRDAFNNQQQGQQPQQPQQSQSFGSNIRANKMSTMSNNHFQELENRLSEKVRDNLAISEQQQLEQIQEQRERRSRYAISRRYAAPIERVLRLYDDVHTDFYLVLDVPRNVDEFSLKRQYRSLALHIHPDKNPHPDAKNAFDAIQDAYDVLANPAKRKEYDRELNKIARSKAWTVKRVSRRIQDAWRNLKAQVLLTWYQYRRGESKEELEHWKERFLGVKRRVIYFAEHLSLLPTAMDRWQLVNELWWRQRYYLLVISLILPSMSSLFLRPKP